ncbi:hypothetical protein J2741_001706 [Methanolinea mesophila]|uniref:hypothetical protein n=1 Tax=Methanolinea mesophila TaxID=547055 RepID=UPI001AEA07E0|nr:hypothetical protein [Methanolinea mesophila]MBP1929159.1 hypothetical protein [Methanolinea mesophila]
MSDIEPIDWRVQAYLRVTGVFPPPVPGKPSFIPGEIAYVNTVSRDSNGELIGFITPAPFKLAMDIAINSAIKAKKLRKTIAFQNNPYGTGKNVANENLPHLYDFFEYCMIAVTFTLQSIDTYCNSVIERKVTKTFPIKIKNKIKNYNALQLQSDWISTDKKILEILPKLLSQKPINNENPGLWNEYLTIKEIRNNILHLKSQKAYPKNKTKEQSLFYEFLSLDVKKIAFIGINMLEYFEKNQGNGPWFKVAYQKLSE